MRNQSPLKIDSPCGSALGAVETLKLLDYSTDWVSLDWNKRGMAGDRRSVEPDNDRLYMADVTRYAFWESTGHRTDGVWGGVEANRVLELAF